MSTDPLARSSDRSRVDDSVLLDIGPDEDPVPIRRARGYAPEPIELALNGTSGICMGGELKSTVAVVRQGAAILSSTSATSRTRARITPSALPSKI